jgi:hypothetical protein
LVKDDDPHHPEEDDALAGLGLVIMLGLALVLAFVLATSAVACWAALHPQPTS